MPVQWYASAPVEQVIFIGFFMPANIDDLRIRNLRELLTPEALIAEMPASEGLAQHVTDARSAIQAVLNQSDDRLVVVVGPCSIHDPVAAMDYACLLYTSPSPRDATLSRMPSSA